MIPESESQDPPEVGPLVTAIEDALGASYEKDLESDEVLSAIVATTETSAPRPLGVRHMMAESDLHSEC